MSRYHIMMVGMFCHGVTNHDVLSRCHIMIGGDGLSRYHIMIGGDVLSRVKS